MRFEEFVAARSPALLRYARLLTGHREEARDLVQEVLVRALVKWSRVGSVDEPYAYVRRMVTNEFLSSRRRRRVPTVALTPEHDRAVPAGGGPDDRQALWQLLGELPRQQRAVLVLRYYEDLTDDEIGETLGCRVGSVRGYASRALATLRITATTSAEEVRP